MKLPKLPKISLPKVSMPKISMPKVSEAYNAGGSRRDLQFRVMYYRPKSEEDKTQDAFAEKLAQNEENRANYNFLEKAFYDLGYKIMDAQIRSIEKGMNKSKRKD